MEWIRRFIAWIKYWYFQWELASMLVVMDPIEKYVFHAFTLILLAVVIYSTVSVISGIMPYLSISVQKYLTA